MDHKKCCAGQMGSADQGLLICLLDCIMFLSTVRFEFRFKDARKSKVFVMGGVGEREREIGGGEKNNYTF